MRRPPTGPALLLALALTACPSATGPAPAPGNPPVTPDGPAPGGSAGPSTATVRAASVLPAAASGLEEQLSRFALDGVLFASENRGVLTTTGTIAQTAPNAPFSYAPDPADRLVIAFADGVRLEYAIDAARLEGNVVGGARDFLDGPHRLGYSVRLTGSTSDISEVDWIVASRQADDRVTRTRVVGATVFEGGPRNVELARARSVLSEVGPGSNRYEHEETLTGTVLAGALTLAVSEQSRFKLVNNVVNSTRSFDSAWTEGAGQFRLAGLVRLSLTDGRPSEPDFWLAEGALTRDGQTIGTIGGKFSGDPFEVFLDGPSGRVVLETHSAL